MRLDPKTARTIANAKLKAQGEDIKAAICSLANRSSFGLSQKGNPLQRRMEKDAKTAFGDSLIGVGWSSRTFHYFIFEIHKSDNDRPRQLAINGCSINTRSNAPKFRQIALITMHAMERLLERRCDTELIQLAREEFDMTFVNTMVFGETGTPLAPNDEFRVRTLHGSACGIVSELGVPIVRTWIHKPGGWPTAQFPLPASISSYGTKAYEPIQ